MLNYAKRFKKDWSAANPTAQYAAVLSTVAIFWCAANSGAFSFLFQNASEKPTADPIHIFQQDPEKINPLPNLDWLKELEERSDPPVPRPQPPRQVHSRDLTA